MSSYLYIIAQLMIYNQIIQTMTTNIFNKTFETFKRDQKISEISKECKISLKTNIFQTIRSKVGEIIDRFSYFQQKYYSLSMDICNDEWREDEKKVFMCFLLAFSRLCFRKISQITQNEWNQISQAFGNKNALFLKYEARTLQKSNERVRWDQEEELFLQSCIKNQMKGKWSEISKLLFFQSQGRFSKTPKQCRQHWFNHMDKSVSKGQWTIQQDLIILKSVLDYGHKWARIVDLLVEKRTQHMIKNRFHSILTAFYKFTQSNTHKNQRRIIKNLIKQLKKRRKTMPSYKKKPFNSLSSSSNQSIIQQNLSRDNKRQLVRQQQSYLSRLPQKHFDQISIIQNPQGNIKHPTLGCYPTYQVNPFNTFIPQENPFFYRVNPCNSLLIYPMLVSNNDVLFYI